MEALTGKLSTADETWATTSAKRYAWSDSTAHSLGIDGCSLAGDCAET